MLDGDWEFLEGKQSHRKYRCALHVRVSITLRNVCFGCVSVYVCMHTGPKVKCISVGHQDHLENPNYLVFIICLPLGLIILTLLLGHFLLLTFIFYFFGLFRAAPTAYGSSHANQSYSCWPTPEPSQRQILNPLNEARDRACNLMVPSQIVSAAPRRQLPIYS